MKKTRLVFDKPVYLGMCILDLSKTLMYDFHYNYMKQKYGDKAKLLFTDTNSLMYEIETPDFYEDISANVKDKFDTSNYPSDRSSGIPTGFNKKVLGMFKDEVGGEIIDEFVGLRAKLHCPPKVPSHTVFQKLFSFSYLKQKLNIISIDLLYTLHPHFNLPINKQYQK